MRWINHTITGMSWYAFALWLGNGFFAIANLYSANNGGTGLNWFLCGLCTATFFWAFLNESQNLLIQDMLDAWKTVLKKTKNLG